MNSKIAYLTIDDAPSADFEQKIDFLHSKGIPAIFFCPGNALETRPEPIIDAIHQGFVIANHAYDHPHFSGITLEACLEQIRKTDQILEAIYRQAGVSIPAKYFRFPYGDKGALTGDDPFAPVSGPGRERKQIIQAELRRLGYTQPDFPDVTYDYYRAGGLLDDVDWFWTYDVVEWSTFHAQHAYGIETLADVFARMDENVPEGGRGLNDFRSAEIILTHDHVETTLIFTAIIERLLSKGLDFRLPA
ncbi:MAG TPA: polysaccharide deacetylase [Chloroflexi bacterium]|nr:polysaccharide deacetylase [Chloroflexota bacterium]